MPSIKEAIKANQSRIAAGGETGTGVGLAPPPTAQNLVSIPAPPQLDLPIGLPQRGIFPANTVLASDRSANSREFRSMGMRSSTFPYSTATPSVTKSTVVNNITNTSAATILILQTNNVKNPVQNVLNLIAGNGITLMPDNSGGVTIVGAGGDSVVHGTSLWEPDPGMIVWRDDFLFSQATGDGAGTVGELNWSWSSPTNTGQGGGEWNSAPPYLGITSIRANAVANTFGWLFPVWMTTTFPNPNNPPGMPIFDYPSFKCSWVFQLSRSLPQSTNDNAFTGSPVLPKTSFYIGFFGWDSNPISARNTLGARPYNFVGLRYDQDNTSPAISDTTFHFEAVSNTMVNTYARNNTQGNTYDTGVTPAQDTWYRLDIMSTIRGQVQMNLTGGGVSTGFQTLNIPTYSFTGATITFNATTGPTLINLTTASLTNLVGSGAGTIVGVTGWSGGSAGSAFSKTAVGFNDTEMFFNYDATLGSTTNQSGATFTFYPAMYPAVIFGNDSEGSPTANRALYIDFFSFLWNPGVGSGGSPDASKPRYW